MAQSLLWYWSVTGRYHRREREKNIKKVFLCNLLCYQKLRCEVPLIPPFLKSPLSGGFSVSNFSNIVKNVYLVKKKSLTTIPFWVDNISVRIKKLLKKAMKNYFSRVIAATTGSGSISITWKIHYIISFWNTIKSIDIFSLTIIME